MALTTHPGTGGMKGIHFPSIIPPPTTMASSTISISTASEKRHAPRTHAPITPPPSTHSPIHPVSVNLKRYRWAHSPSPGLIRVISPPHIHSPQFRELGYHRERAALRRIKIIFAALGHDPNRHDGVLNQFQLEVPCQHRPE